MKQKIQQEKRTCPEPSRRRRVTENSRRLESHSYLVVPEKAERTPVDAELDRELSAWAQERNIDIEDFERVV